MVRVRKDTCQLVASWKRMHVFTGGIVGQQSLARF